MPSQVGHGRDELRRLVRVARVEDGAAVHRAHHREVLERHLRGAVLADRDAGVRADELDVRPADGGHADEVVGAREERGEGRGERLPAAHLHPDRGGDQLLLGDVHLEEALRDAPCANDLGVGRVAHLAVERDDVAAGGAERGQRVAVGLARRDLLAELVARQLERLRSRRRAARPGVGLAARRPCRSRIAAELGDRAPRGRRAPCRASPPCPRRRRRPCPSSSWRRSPSGCPASSTASS